MTLATEFWLRRLSTSPCVSISPAFRKLPPPVLVVGMHRSGTSLVAGMLATLGIYMDPLFGSSAADGVPSCPDTLARRNGYGEAIAFRLLNESILSRAGATWKNVTPFLRHREEPGFARGTLLQIQAATFTSLYRNYLRGRPQGAASAWGWKDPRNSILLPYWLCLFPGARILHVRRDPEAVVRSLQRREEAQHSANAGSVALSGRLRQAALHPGQTLRAVGRRCGFWSAGTGQESRAWDREDWLRLSAQYVAECLKYRSHAGGYLEVCYEDILADPIQTASKMADFTGADIALSQVLRAAAFVVVDRQQAQV